MSHTPTSIQVHVVAISILLIFALSGCAGPQQAPGKPWHHTTEGFRNPEGSPVRSSWTERLPWVMGRFVGFSMAAQAAPLWAGWDITSRNGARVYFGGDADYGPVYRRIARRHGGFDTALLSIGAFLPRIVMNGAHCVPETCLKISRDLRAHTHLAMHWGTVQLGDDRPLDAIRRFRAGGRALGIPDDRLWLMNIGETRILPRRDRKPIARR